MPATATSGVFIYAKDRHRLARFYASVLGLAPIHESEDLTVLQSASLQLIVHAIPQHIAATIDITSPPQPREDTALKFFFTAPNIANCRSDASALGGEVFGEEWKSSGFIVCNAIDPEGNIFQLRQPIEPL
ncbi:MAG: glyoxalase/bleomycin resistance/dioxygenase family protein [Ignavibacteria bacterium]|nr:glyoxalase/bleomycin resistance/dioxygenase family protein [Ignavibacteria bacterium]MBL7992172.1 glyoxalase/bleomycin resistance/dioxygenase family protein [Candidatus Kapabacteria bacterium]